MDTTYVFGAGADSGIFPLTNHLVTAINRYLTTDPGGKEVDRLLKGKLGFSTFSYASIMDTAAYTFIHRNDPSKTERLNQKIHRIDTENLSDSQTLQLEFMESMTECLIRTPKKTRDREPAVRHRKMLDLAKKIGLEKMVTVCPETTLSMFYRQSIRMLLRKYLDEPENRVLHTLFKCTVNLDEILLEYFLGFYNGNKTCIRRYEYLLWTMWAFFVDTEYSYWKSGKLSGNIYSMVHGCPAITLNYTTLAATCPGCPELIHFHGSVLDYIDCRTRDERRIPSFTGIDSIAQATDIDSAAILRNEILPLIEVRRGKDSPLDTCVVPSMMPPFEIKPIIANDLIDTWHHAFELLRKSRRIVVIGYSFNHTDAHFNDIIMDFAGKRNPEGEWKKLIYIINPDVESIHQYFDSLRALDGYSWSPIHIPGTDLECQTKANIILIPGTTWDIMGTTGRHLSLDL